MKAINYTSLRGQMKSYMDMISDTFETLVVTRKNGKNIIMMSEDTYNNLIENSYLTSNKANYDWLMESKKQLESGIDVIRKDINEL
ncbi:MAG TPA: type II toxin-antitoxin system Phd/YefM family antitoxin [Candidatus Massiliomicrobiota merdigallinarum]|nr:type II toxin-antitoxin system Phd/YefM family antitoxin [Candidatus Massilimicrobiota merdigallinarum]